MNKSNHETTKDTIQKLLEQMGMRVESIEMVDDGIGIVRFNVRSYDARALIGYKGETLQAINLIAKKLLEPDEENEESEADEDTLNFIVDIDDYQKERLIELKNHTRIIAERAKLFGRELPLPAMSSYERMIVHSVAKTIEGISTESRGEGRERYVVVKPKEN